REGGHEPEPGPDEPGPGRHGRHTGDADPLPPLEGPMPGGGPAPAETTLPLALSWAAPPPRTPRFTPSDQAGPPGAAGSAGAPPDWRRVGRPSGSPAPGHAPPQAPRPGSVPPRA